MNLQKINVKFFIENPENIDLETFVPIFHRWIQEQNFNDLLIDVADYRHVPSGPGILLIGNHVNYSIDNAQSRLGFLYNQKRNVDGTNLERLKSVFRNALNVCQKLENEENLKGKLKFRTDEVQFIVNDRILSPNCNETLQALKPELASLFDPLYGANNYSLHRHDDPRERFTLDLKASVSVSLGEFLKKIG